MITRRQTMIATAGLAAAAALPPGSTAEAAAPKRGERLPAVYRFALGELEVTLVHDGHARRPLDANYVRNAPLEEVRAALVEAFQPADAVLSPFTTVVVNTGAELVAIDAGNGDLGAPGTGLWRANLAAAGYRPDEIDVVIVSHFHGDHINGIRLKDGTPGFPNARLLVPEAEWAFWMDDGQMSRAPEAMQGAFRNVRRVFGPEAQKVERFSGERELVSGVTAVPAFGHTPGHHAFRLASGGQSLLVLSDAATKPELFVRRPDWQVMFDMDGPRAAETRKRLLDMLATERTMVAGYHFPFPAVGYIAREGSGYRFVPAFWT
ncbi:MAG: MBL fold metallo-hydrolase [Geminicoccaceae bacterium]|nr:MBL fold metallo-hydrolase [Geminicoccaceae bacterium]MCS7268139.1 MBL fold metallo-hydrolase [Geminicoccaceae bacterium]MDW8125957.1 MBL fold metallo-hydrolase [Geminicoccaceae bacterium]MDW8341677.1 MBL fold metallo-hydrolase [Geminicoccaceae bacterium]MDW8444018.1 MBL fold metallo-hydrolase [Acetobacteraceae bacterium]